MKIDPANLKGKELHDLLGDVMNPVPIALVSTVGRDGTYNAAPFSCFARVCMKPPIVCLSFGLRKGEKKDTVRNMEFSGDFVINIVDDKIAEAAIKTANQPSGVDETKVVGLTAIASEKVKSPRIAEAPVSMECRLIKTIELGEGSDLRNVVFGEVVLFHIKDGLCANGNVVPSKLVTVGALGRGVYARTSDRFEVKEQGHG